VLPHRPRAARGVPSGLVARCAARAAARAEPLLVAGAT
jgi:hypothetical protein